MVPNTSTVNRATNRRVVFRILGSAEGIEQRQAGPGADTLR
jgi:hypothetical protein